jgi:hypothetical protein
MSRLEPCRGSLSWQYRTRKSTEQHPLLARPRPAEPDADVCATVDDMPWDDAAWLLYLKMDFYSDTYFPAFPEIPWIDSDDTDEEEWSDG